MRNTALGPSKEWAAMPEREQDGELLLCGWKKNEAWPWCVGSFPETGQRSEVVAIQLSRDGRTPGGKIVLWD